MNETYNHIYEEEKTISLVDLCFYILKRWRIMVIVALLAALIMVGYSGLTSYRNYQATKNAPDMPPVELTDSEISGLQTKLQSIKVYEDNVNAYQTYLEQSIKCKLDPNGFYEGSVNYVITLESDEEIMSAKTICEAEILNAEVYETLAEVLKEDAAASKVGEVVSLSTEKAASGNELLMRLKVTARYYTEKGCQKMLTVLSEAIESVSLVAIRDDVGEFEKISERILFTSDASLIDAKQGILNSKTSANKNLTDLKNSITENQKKYQAWLESSAEEETVKEEAKFKLSVNWKYVIIAAVAGAICVAGFYGVIYLFNGRIHTKEELESYLKVPVLSLGKGKNDNTPEMIATMLSGYIVAQDIKSLYLTGSLGEKQAETMKELEGLLQKKGVKIHCGNSILTDASALQQAIDSGCVVFLEKCNETLEKKVVDEIEKAAFCGVKVLGMILEK